MRRLRRFDVGPHLVDKGCDTDAFRAFVKRQKIRIVIPGKSSRKKGRISGT
jgi:hypothetical protein